MQLKEEFLCKVFSLYRNENPITYHVVDTSHGEDDFRQAIFAEWSDRKLVIKIASNGFTTLHRVQGWSDTIQAYRGMGYYCPAIIPTRSGSVAAELNCEGKPCVIFAEEYAAEKTAEQWGKQIYRPNGEFNQILLDNIDSPIGKPILFEYVKTATAQLLGVTINCFVLSVMFGGIVSEIELPEDRASGNFFIKLLPPEDGKMFSSTRYFLSEEELENVKAESSHMEEFEKAEELDKY